MIAAACCLQVKSCTLQVPLQVQEEWREEELNWKAGQVRVQVVPTTGGLEEQVTWASVGSVSLMAMLEQPLNW